MEAIGFIGVGAMGASIASRLVGSYDLLVNDRNPAAAGELVKRGARFATVAEIAESCKVVVLCLPAPKHVTDLMLGDGRLANMLRRGSVVIDTTTSVSTTDVQVAAALAARGIDFVDSPISGGVSRAREGDAVLMVGAAPEVFARVEGILKTVTPRVIHVGPTGTGHAMKLVNNMLNAINRFAALESIRLGVLAGMDQDTVVEVLNQSSGRNYTTENTYPKLLSGDTYLPQGFTLELMLKDVRLAGVLAADFDHPAPLGALTRELVERAVNRFGPHADQSQMMAEWYGDRPVGRGHDEM